MTTTRFALIDTTSGYVWGVAIASSPIEACRTVDTEIGMGSHCRRYTETSDTHSTGAGYRVYAIPMDLVIDDGQDGATINAVEASDFAGYVRCDDVDQDDEASAA